MRLTVDKTHNETILKGWDTDPSNIIYIHCFDG